MKNSGKHGLVKIGVLLTIAVLAISAVVDSANAALTLENIKTWRWTGHTMINSVARGDIDHDGWWEIVTGGSFNDGTRDNAQLCIWNGANLVLERVKTWYWSGHTTISSVALGNPDGDSDIEVVTAGYYWDGTRNVAQLCVWDSTTWTLENIKTWYWSGSTYLWSVAIINADGDGQIEIVTGGAYTDGAHQVAQLCIWNGATLALENVKTWQWTSDTRITSLAAGDVDGDSDIEIVTGGHYFDGTRTHAQLCIWYWNGAALALENIETWYWTDNTAIDSVAIGNVDVDPALEIVTGGYYNDGTRYVAQLCVWNGATLGLERVQTWYWNSHTYINSVVRGDVDADPGLEIVTGGWYFDNTRWVCQLCVWSGASLALENVQTWYWSSENNLKSVVTGDVDSDGDDEIVTGGFYWDGPYKAAQLCVWI